MSKHHHDDSGDLHFEQVSHHGVAYEDRDLGGRGIIVFLVVLVVATALLCLVVWGYYEYRGKIIAAPTARSAAELPPSVPTGANELERFKQRHGLAVALQTDDVADMHNLRMQQDATLKSYGWVDQKAGLVHIPIDEAMKTLVQQGLPVRPAPQSAPKAEFGSGISTPQGAGGGTRPETRQ
jgi:hypothetical protein